MNDNQFDELVKRKLREVDLKVPEDNIDRIIKKAMQKANRPRWRSLRIIAIAAIIFFGLISTAAILQQKEQAKVPDQNTVNNKSEKENAPKVAVVDIQQEKKKLVSEGYLVEPRTELPEGYNGNGSGLRDMEYISTLKDSVYNARSMIKGKVLGVKYFIQNDTAFTKAKVLVEESYTGTYQQGNIVTVIKAGAIISHYEMIIMEGIDQKFNIPENELEQAKQKMVVHDNWGQMIFPDETMILFIGGRAETNEKNDEAYYVGEPVVKFHEGKILTPERGMEDGYIFEEFFFTDQLDKLEGKIDSIVKEKESYTQEKARKAAFNYLPEQDKQQVVNQDEATVRYSTRGIFINSEKSPENVIIVTFTLNSDGIVRVILTEKDYKLYKIEK